MDIRKFAQIALKDIRSQFTDRGGLVITVLTPFVLTLVLAAAFGGIKTSGADSPIKDIPVIVVNQDNGTILFVVPTNFGKQLTDTLSNLSLSSSGKLLDVTVLTDETEAKAQVKAGKASAAILIPAGFSESLNPASPSFGDNKITLNIFRDAGQALNADIVSGVVRQILNGYASTMIAINAGAKVDPGTLLHAQDIAQKMAQQMMSQGTAAASTATSQTSNQANNGPQFNFLQYFAPAMAVFFLNFLLVGGAMSIIEEKDNGTLQRLLTSPTQRMTILAGKLGGTYVNGVLQLTILIVATTLIGVLTRNPAPVWGTNIPALILTVLIVVAGAMGLGTLLAALARSRQQAQVLSNAVLVLMGIVGGSFFLTSGGPPMGVLSQLTVNYWANHAFATLSATGDLTAIMPNLAALLIMFVVGFGSGLYLFSRRLEV